MKKGRANRPHGASTSGAVGVVGGGGASAKDSFPEGDIFLSVPKTLYPKATSFCQCQRLFSRRRHLYVSAKDSSWRRFLFVCCQCQRLFPVGDFFFYHCKKTFLWRRNILPVPKTLFPKAVVFCQRQRLFWRKANIFNFCCQCQRLFFEGEHLSQYGTDAALASPAAYRDADFTPTIHAYKKALGL